jgi:hypothetical protein
VGWCHYRQQRAKGSSHHVAVRALAFKWIRVLYRCWQNCTPYNKTVYLNVLRKRRFALCREAEHLGQDRVLLFYLIGASRAAARPAEGEARGETVGNEGTAVRRLSTAWGSVVVHGRARDDRHSKT